METTSTDAFIFMGNVPRAVGKIISIENLTAIR